MCIANKLGETKWNPTNNMKKTGYFSITKKLKLQLFHLWKEFSKNMMSWCWVTAEYRFTALLQTLLFAFTQPTKDSSLLLKMAISLYPIVI
ncbi:hypothetical protein NIES21_17470 [Anabaenopsis circularis NIES-21]|uniref:Uncharacterized protein n=1 Tax=Anabaenopsis circularis NIES-21 TaxID=1085406 RepID=A0A1Z4GF05_9CYAN|nr:hypothetical protein NIES21_17470 [Anabaenopsis circularis NIES-21]